MGDRSGGVGWGEKGRQKGLPVRGSKNRLGCEGARKKVKVGKTTVSGLRNWVKARM